MSTAAVKRQTEEEYLATERLALEKSEYFDGEVFAMSGASFAHNVITRNLIVMLANRLKGTHCQPLSSDMRIAIPPKRKYTYADVLVVCGPPQFTPVPPDNLLNPKLIVEVLSPSTEIYDRTTKFRHYRSIDAFEEYVLVEQDEPEIDSFTRGDNGVWVLNSASGLEANLKLSSINCELRLSDVYQDVDFSRVPLRSPTPDGPEV